MDLVVGRTVFSLVVIGIQQQNGAREHVHDVRRCVAHDHGRGKAVGQFAFGIQHGDEAVELILRRKFAHEQQIRHFLVAEATVAAFSQQVVHVVPPITQRPVVGYLLIVRHHVAMHVRDVRHAGDHAGAIGVAQATLHVELVVVRRIDGVDRLEVLVERELLFLFLGLDVAHKHNLSVANARLGPLPGWSDTPDRLRTRPRRQCIKYGWQQEKEGSSLA